MVISKDRGQCKMELNSNWRQNIEKGKKSYDIPIYFALPRFISRMSPSPLDQYLASYFGVEDTKYDPGCGMTDEVFNFCSAQFKRSIAYFKDSYLFRDLKNGKGIC